MKYLAAAVIISTTFRKGCLFSLLKTLNNDVEYEIRVRRRGEEKLLSMVMNNRHYLSSSIFLYFRWQEYWRFAKCSGVEFATTLTWSKISLIKNRRTSCTREFRDAVHDVL
jgi:hypothetical protein